MSASASQSSQEEIFQEIYHQYRDWVQSLVFKITRSHSFSEDIAQEVFLRVWLHRLKWPAIRHRRSWIYIIAKRLTLDHFMRLSKERFILNQYKPLSSHSQNEDSLLPSRCQRLMEEAERKLSMRQKQVYYLKVIRGLSNQDIARRLAITESTTSHHIKAAKRIVRETIVRQVG